jgi:hypothetical protein
MSSDLFTPYIEKSCLTCLISTLFVDMDVCNFGFSFVFSCTRRYCVSLNVRTLFGEVTVQIACETWAGTEFPWYRLAWSKPWWHICLIVFLKSPKKTLYLLLRCGGDNAGTLVWLVSSAPYGAGDSCSQISCVFRIISQRTVIILTNRVRSMFICDFEYFISLFQRFYFIVNSIFVAWTLSVQRSRMLENSSMLSELKSNCFLFPSHLNLKYHSIDERLAEKLLNLVSSSSRQILLRRFNTLPWLLHEHFVKNGCFHCKHSRYRFKFL